jgi:hypothetical protein
VAGLLIGSSIVGYIKGVDNIQSKSPESTDLIIIQPNPNSLDIHTLQKISNSPNLSSQVLRLVSRPQRLITHADINQPLAPKLINSSSQSCLISVKLCSLEDRGPCPESCRKGGRDCIEQRRTCERRIGVYNRKRAGAPGINSGKVGRIVECGLATGRVGEECYGWRSVYFKRNSTSKEKYPKP